MDKGRLESEILKVLGMLSSRHSGNACGKFFWKSDNDLKDNCEELSQHGKVNKNTPLALEKLLM